MIALDAVADWTLIFIAIGSIATAVVAGFTWRLAAGTKAEIAANWRPVLLGVETPEHAPQRTPEEHRLSPQWSGTDFTLAVRNVGRGPALHCYVVLGWDGRSEIFTISHGETEIVRFRSLEKRYVPEDDITVANIHYDDLAGNHLASWMIMNSTVDHRGVNMLWIEYSSTSGGRLLTRRQQIERFIRFNILRRNRPPWPPPVGSGKAPCQPPPPSTGGEEGGDL